MPTATTTSTTELVKFLQEVDDLIKRISNTAQPLPVLFQEHEANRNRASAMLDDLQTTQTFRASNDPDVLKEQRELLIDIQNTSKSIQDYQDAPAIQASLYAHRGLLYAALANTYDDTFSWVITFTPQELDRLGSLLTRATLDAQERQKAANVLDAAVQISKFVLGILMGIV